MYFFKVKQKQRLDNPEVSSKQICTLTASQFLKQKAIGALYFVETVFTT